VTVPLARRVLWTYGWQLLVLAAVALAPVLLIALRAPVPADAAVAKTVSKLAWPMIAFAVVGQLMLAGAAAVHARAIGTRVRTLRTFGAAALQLARAVIPCLVALAAVAIGGMALVLPGVALFVLLSLTAASPELGEPLPAPLVDSIAIVRTRLAAVAIVLAAMIAVDVAIVIVAQRLFTVPISKAPTVHELASYRLVLRVAAVALVAISPVPACALAVIRNGDGAQLVNQRRASVRIR